MSAYTILIKSSSGGCYNIACDLTVFQLTCDCPAGAFGDFCKHLKTFFEADRSLLFQENQLADFEQICTALKTAEIYSAYVELQGGLKELDRQKKSLTKQGGELKAAFVRKLRGQE